MVKERLAESIQRKKYKKVILYEYWRMIVDRCQRLQIRHQGTQLKKIQFQKLELISHIVRDQIISVNIKAQEEKYVENVRKFEQRLKECKDPRQRICSRLLKIYSDEYMLKQRNYEKDIELIKIQIDSFLPLVDPSKEDDAPKKDKAKHKKSNMKDAQKGGKNASLGKNSAVKSVIAEKQVTIVDKKQARKILRAQQSDLTAHKDAMGDLSYTSSEEEEILSPADQDKKATDESIEGITMEEHEIRETQRKERTAKKKQKMDEHRFLTRLRMFSMLTPSMEYIPEIKDMIAIM